MKKLLCLFGLSALVLTSCSSGGDSSTTTESDVLVKKSVESDALSGTSLTTNYTYNGKKLVKETDSDGYYQTYTYTGDLITKITYYNDTDDIEETETFTYNADNKMIRYVRSEPIDDLGSKEEFVYNSNGTISSTTYSGDALSQTTLMNTSIIYFSGGEVSMIKQYDGSTLVSTRTYTYDAKNSPFKNVIGFDKITAIEAESTGSGHNVLTDNYTEASNNYIYTSTYTYNTLNFPLTWSEIEGTDATSVITTQYTYN